MKLFKELTEAEKAMLIKFPAFISMLAANSDDKLDEVEKKSAIKFSHIKTYSCDPLLTEFYEEADKVFDNNIQQLDNDLPIEKEAREAVLKKELANLEKIVLKLGEEYSTVMHRSMNSFKNHVSHAHHSVLVDFIFPVPMKGLTY
ncbi:MAG: hypothetical protein M3004_14530 [Bacteroidota bacterium]|nr:hypothetical protein [Bacteroidota bacterium]